MLNFDFACRKLGLHYCMRNGFIRQNCRITPVIRVLYGSLVITFRILLGLRCILCLGDLSSPPLIPYQNYLPKSPPKGFKRSLLAIANILCFQHLGSIAEITGVGFWVRETDIMTEIIAFGGKPVTYVTLTWNRLPQNMRTELSSFE